MTLSFKKITLLFQIAFSGLLVHPLFSYYPGSPDRNLSVLQTAEITENKHLFTRFNHRFEKAIFPDNEPNPAYQLFGLDGPANIYIDAGFGLANIAEITISRQRFDKIYGLELKLLGWNQRVDSKPFSLAATLNSQVKTERSITDSRRLSLGTTLILSRSLFNDHLELIHNSFFQSNTNSFESSGPDHSIATGFGLIYRLNRTSLFVEYIFPHKMDLGNVGFVENNFALQSYGFNYRIFNHSFAIMISNYHDIHAVNFMTGPTNEDNWLHDMALGFNITRTFKLMH